MAPGKSGPRPPHRRWTRVRGPARGLALLLACALGVAGCGGPAAPADLRFGLAQGPRLLDPRLASDAASERVNRLLYARLVEFDAASRPVPGLASWERLDPTRYRFTLAPEPHPGRRFSDGRRLTAADVAATYRSLLDPATASPHRAVLAIIDDIRVLDDERLEFRLREPDPQFPAYLGIGILPAAALAAGEDLARAPIGSGGFRLLGWPRPGELLLERRADGLRVGLVTVKDPNVRAMKLLRGEVDLLQNDLPAELVGWLRRRPGVRVETAPGVNFSYLGGNLDHPAIADRRVRLALAHAIDREAILRALYHGAGRPAEALFPPEHWVGVPVGAGALTPAENWPGVPRGAGGLTPYRHDPARARALLAAAGYGPARPLRLSLSTSTDPARLRFATVLQAQLAAVGVDLRVRSFDWGTFFGDIRAGRFELYGLTWVGVRNPDIFRYALHSAATPPDGANRGRYRNPAADALIDAARREPDPARQVALYRALQTLLHADLPYIPLWYEDQVLVVRNNVIGYRLAADGNYDGLLGVRLVAAGASRPGLEP